MKCRFLIFSLLICVFYLPAVSDDKKPNILILYADDLGLGDLGCYNKASKIPTPHLDKLAHQGMRFTDGHSSSGICTPSRYALLTGRYHWRDFHDIVGPMGKSVFKSERLTLPEMLQQKGYHTAAIGKWHLGWDWTALHKKEYEGLNVEQRKRKFKVRGFDGYDWSKRIPDGPLAHGFDYYFGDTVINFPPYAWIENDKLVKAPDTMMDTKKWKKIKEGNWECRRGPMCSDWDPYQNIPVTTAKAVHYIKEQAKSEKPFFLYFAFPSPHAPIIPNDDFDGKSQAGPYGDFVFETDDACGNILAALEESGQSDNTIVIFSADNGPEHYAYDRDTKYGHWSSYPLRGLKRDIYEGGHRVPFIVRYPGVVKQGGVCETLVSQIDIMATLAAVTGFQLSKNMAEDSHDLLPIWKGEKKSVRDTHVHNTFPKAWAIRHGDWLLLEAKSGYHSRVGETWEKKYKYPEDDKKPVELYNLAKDIEQRNNLAVQHSDRVEQLSALLKKIRDQGVSAPRLTKDKQ